MQAQAMTHLDRLALDPGRALPHGLCLYDPQWHAGVVGILASRVKERTHRPVIAFAPEDDHALKGSARSVAGLHMRDALDTVSKREPGLITRFGGHAMAAGLTLPRAHFDRFAQAFDEVVRASLDDGALDGTIETDGELAGDELGLDLAAAVRDAGPWGPAFPEPLFDGVFRVHDTRLRKDVHLRLTVTALGGSPRLEAIAFNAVNHGWPLDAEQVRLVYRLEVNSYRGLDRAQLVVTHMEAASGG